MNFRFETLWRRTGDDGVLIKLKFDFKLVYIHKALDISDRTYLFGNFLRIAKNVNKEHNTLFGNKCH